MSDTDRSDRKGERDPSARRVARNTGLAIGAEVVGKAAPLVLFALIARILGARTLGDYVLAFAVTSLIFPVATLGMDRLLVREASQDRGAVDRLFFDLVALKAIVSVGGVLAAAAVMALLGYPERVVTLTLLLGFATVLNILGASALGVFQAYERMEYHVYSTLPQKYLSAGLGIAVLLLGGSIVAVAAGVLIASGVGLVIAFVLQFRFFRRPPLRIHAGRWRAIVRDAMPFGLQELFAQVLFRIDIVLLSLYTSSAVVGWYGASYRLLEASLFVSWSVASAVMPMFSYLGEDTRPSLSTVYEKSVKFLLALTVPIGVVLVVEAEALIELIYGLERFDPSVGALRLLGGALILYAVTHLTGALVLARRRGGPFVWATAGVALLNVALNLVLIPRLSLDGAAAATLISELVLVVLALVLAQRLLGRLRLMAMASGPLVAGAAMGIVMIALNGELLLTLPLGTLAYLLVLCAFEFRRFREDAEVARSILRRRTARQPG